MAMDDKNEDFGIEYFKALRAEIDLRIKNQAYYTISKIVACGALLGYLAEEGFTQGLIAVPLVAVLLDFRIHNNVAKINSIGKYIRDELETKCFKKVISGWTPYESKYGQTKSAGKQDLLGSFGQIGITIALFLLSLLLFSNKEPWTGLSTVTWLVLTALLVIDLVLGIFLRASE